MINKNIKIVLDIETIPNQKLFSNFENLKEKDLISEIINRKLENKKDKDIIKYTSISWEFNQIICIGIKINEATVKTFIDTDEKYLLNHFWEYLEEYNSNETKFITFNGKRFDIPIIMLHSALLKTFIPFKISNKRYDTFKHYDVLEILSNYYQDQNFLTLKDYCKVFEIENNDEDNGSNVYKLFQDEKLEEIKNHCIEDIESTKKLYDRIREYV